MAVEDIIYGKNRHMFGGIEPSNMKIFKADSSIVPSGIVQITAQIPDDTVIEGQTLCTVAGAVVRRRYDRYPKDEFDGDLICTITDKEPFVMQDNAISTDEEYKTCFYAAFPYTTLDVYNRSAVNRFTINPVNSLDNFSTVRKYDVDTSISTIIVSGTFAVGEGIKGTKGVMIRKSVTAYPTNITDGDLVADILRSDDTNEFTYVDSNIDNGVMYYYSAFTYDYNDVYNTDDYNKSSNVVQTYDWLYGFDLDTNDSNPYTRVTYPLEVDNAYYTPVSHTGDSNPGSSSDPNNYVFSYGDWLDCGFMPKPCMLKNDGTVIEYLDPNDYTKTITGEDSTVGKRYTNRVEQTHAMMEWGKIWTKRWEDENGIYHFRCASEQLDDSYDCWCNYDKDNNQIDNFYTSIYPLHVNTNSGGYMSISGYVATEDISRSGFFTELSTYNLSGWSPFLIADRLLIQDLLVLIGKSTDTQAVFGTEQSTAWDEVNGKLDKSGLFGKYGNNVKVFGMENWWNLHHYIHGWCADDLYVSCLKITPGTHDGSTQVGFEKLSSSADVLDRWINIKLGNPASSGTKIGYIKTMKTYPYGRIPYTEDTKFNGSASTYECDGIYVYGSSMQMPAVTYSRSTSTDVSGRGAFGVAFTNAIREALSTAQRLSYKVNSTTW